MTATTLVPIVGCLDLTAPQPRLVGQECTECGATFFERRVTCANCGGGGFRARVLPSKGIIHSYTIVHRAPDGVTTPYIAAVVCLDDATHVRTNIVGLEPDPEAIAKALRVRLVTFAVGTDQAGQQAIAFAFAPVEGLADEQ